MAKFKDVTIGSGLYRVRKMNVDDGTYIYMRMMGCVMDVVASKTPDAQKAQAELDQDDKDKLTPEDRAKLLCGLAFTHGFSYDDSKFARRAAMQVTSKVEDGPTGELILPVMSSDGRWTPGVGLEDEPALVQELTLEVLAFNLAPFFEQRMVTAT